MYSNNPIAMNTQDPGTLAIMRSLLGQNLINPQAQAMQDAGQNMQAQASETNRPLTNLGNKLGGAVLSGMGRTVQNGADLQAQAPSMQGPMPNGGSLDIANKQRALQMQNNPLSYMLGNSFGGGFRK